MDEQDSFISKYKQHSNWSDFLIRYKNTFKSYTGFLRIPRDAFDDFKSFMNLIWCVSLEKRASKKHLQFLFVLYIVLNEISNYNSIPLSIQQIKELLGYSRGTDSIDYLIKDKGELDNFEMTFTKSFGVNQNYILLQEKAKSFKTKRLHRKYKITSSSVTGNYVMLNTEVLMYMLFHAKKIKVEGIYLYCYMLTKCGNDGKGNYKQTTILTDKIIRETGISKNSIQKYLGILEEYGLLEIERGGYIFNENQFEGKEVNSYLIVTQINTNCILN